MAGLHLPEDPQAYLQPGEFVDSDHRRVVAFAQQAVGDAASDVDKAVRLFYAVRDGYRYDPYTFSPDRAAYRASHVVGLRRAFCVPKAILLTAAARSQAIPARLGFADVRNHLSSEKLRRLMGTDIFVFHGFAELYLGQQWLKATPSFNVELCEHFGVKPLDFDGRSDALFHEFQPDGRRHMEYVRDRGSFFDLPYERMIEALKEAYMGGAQLDDAGHDEAFHGDE